MDIPFVQIWPEIPSIEQLSGCVVQDAKELALVVNEKLEEKFQFDLEAFDLPRGHLGRELLVEEVVDLCEESKKVNRTVTFRDA